jgi:acylphosphatase
VPATGLIARRAWVSGRVQGVNYRAATALRATQLGVRGYARNLEDGRVEVLALGTCDAVEALLNWLWRGPSFADVTAVDIEEMDPGSLADAPGFRRL